MPINLILRAPNGPRNPFEFYPENSERFGQVGEMGEL